MSQEKYDKKCPMTGQSWIFKFNWSNHSEVFGDVIVLVLTLLQCPIDRIIMHVCKFVERNFPALAGLIALDMIKR
jgi:hypothetical protein